MILLFVGVEVEEEKKVEQKLQSQSPKPESSCPKLLGWVIFSDSASSSSLYTLSAPPSRPLFFPHRKCPYALHISTAKLQASRLRRA